MLSKEYLFVSDCHLQETNRPHIERFICFLNKEAQQVDELYILGDLFDYWIGDDDGVERFSDVISELKKLSQKIPIYFIHGNRDFLIGQDFAESSGCKILDQHTLLALNGIDTLILHGDTLCTLDTTYQRFRTFNHQRWAQRLFLKLSLKLRRKILKQLLLVNTKEKKTKPSEMMDVVEDAVTKIAQHYHVDKIIHGHTHAPKRHPINLGQRMGERIVLGEWTGKGNYLRVSKQQFDYICF
ncbi:MAG: UDP-2,3-diacylglucosamine diphosphatase [Candidatus Oxydemutatoraceae bacterium WSBS_2016_MAG_OTU14]